MQPQTVLIRFPLKFTKIELYSLNSNLEITTASGRQEVAKLLIETILQSCAIVIT